VFAIEPGAGGARVNRGVILAAVALLASLKKLVYLDGEKAVVYRSRMNPFLGGNFEAMDPLEWLARLSDHIPEPGQYRTLFYGEYSSRVRGSGVSAEPEVQSAARLPLGTRASPAPDRARTPRTRAAGPRPATPLMTCCKLRVAICASDAVPTRCAGPRAGIPSPAAGGSKRRSADVDPVPPRPCERV